METYERIRSRAGDGGEEVEDVTGLENCQAWCSSQRKSDCSAFDYNLDDESCWSFDDDFYSTTVEYRRRVDHFIRSEDCLCMLISIFH